MHTTPPPVFSVAAALALSAVLSTPLGSAVAAEVVSTLPAADAVTPPLTATLPKKTVVARAGAKPVSTPTALEYVENKPLTLTMGAIQTLPVRGKIVRVALGSGSVISTTAVDDRLLLIGEQVGTTTLMIWTERAVQSYRVEVVPKDLKDVRARVDAFVEDLPGVTTRQLGSELVVSGTAHKEAVTRLTALLKGTPGVTLNLSEDGGRPYTRSVLFRLHFIEVKKSLIEKIGIDWAKDIQGPVAGATGVAHQSGIYRNIGDIKEGDNLLDNGNKSQFFGYKRGGMFLGLATTITSRINLGISSGDIRVLASPELTAKSGGSAKLQVGGEVPIPIATGLGATNVVFKPYGVMFAIEPFVDANNVITAKVSTELSQIDPSVTVGGIPGFLNRSTSTEVSLKPGEMVALSGLVLSEMSDAVDRLPGLSKVPVFGRLFQSNDFRDRKTELIVLLEPEIITAGDGLAQQLRARGKANIKEFEDKVAEKNKKSEPIVMEPQQENLYGRGE